jgi:hypothetical protein
MISTLIALPYEIARLPLKIVDNTLSDRLSETSAPRVALDRAIGSADKFAGALTRNHDIAQRGAERLERSEKLLTAARLEQEAETRRQQAKQTVDLGQRKAAAKRKAASERVSKGFDEADTVEARGKREAKAKAAKTASAKKTAADQKAANRIETAEQRKRRLESAAEAKQKTSQRKAKNELDDARETKQAAAAARSDAERLSDLTEAKKQERKQD